MKTLKKKSLDQLAKMMPVISEECKRYYIGGTSGSTGDSGGWSGEFGDSGNSGGWSGTPGGLDSSGDWSGDSHSYPLGSANHPYSASEAEQMMDLGIWRGGYVDGCGYVAPQFIVDSGGDGSGSVTGGWMGIGETWDGLSGDLGSPTNPYTMNEVQHMMDSGSWPGGFVEGYGYIAPQIYVNGGTGGGSGGSGTSLPSNTNDIPSINDDISAITGVALGLTNEQVWEQTKYVYFKMAIELGIDLYGLDIQFSSERYAVAWVDNKDRNIKIGNHFFEMSIQDRLAVLVHEYTHLGQGMVSTEVKPLEVPVLLANGSIPPYIDDYIRNNRIEYENASLLSPEQQYQMYITQNDIASPEHYENELNAYLQEKKMCPDVSDSYGIERDFRIWYYSELLKISQKYY